MKKYILGRIMTLIGIFNFSSASTLTINGTLDNGGNIAFNPNVVNFDNTTDLTVISSTCNGSCSIFFNDENYNSVCNIDYSDGSYYYYDNCNNIPAGQYYLNGGGDVFSSIVFNIGGSNSGGGIITGGIEAFSGIIEKLGGIFGEFGPYIIYIAIACLGISLLFKALKYILGFTNNSTKNSIGGRAGMRERRRRRRKMRRYKRTEQEARKYYSNDNYDRNEAGNGKLYRRSRKNSNYLKKYRYNR